MRYLSIILSVYLLALSLIHCSDSQECNDEECVAVIETSGHTDQEHQDEDCSPLCMCNCCGAVILISTFHHDFDCANYTELNFVFSERPNSELSFTIWQPPKIS